MTQDEFAEALRRLVSEAEDAGLEPEAIMAELVARMTPLHTAIIGNPQPRARTRPRMLSSTMTLPTRIISGRSGIALAA